MNKMFKLILNSCLILCLFACESGNGQIIINNKLDISEQQEIESIPSKTSEGDIEDTKNTHDSIAVLNESSYFYIEFIDVGQADAICISCDGHNALIDGGNTSDSDLIFSYLNNNKINHLDFVLNTHPDEDHVGGLAGALNYATIDHAYAPVKDWNTDAFSNYVKYVQKQDKEIEIPFEDQIIQLGTAEIEVMALNIGTESNEKSIILMVKYGDTKILLTGDAESLIETYLISNKDFECDLLKVAHHGSPFSTSYLFLKYANPDICVISVGKNNNYGHPSDLVLSKINDLGAKLYRTDIDGDIKCESDGEEISCSVKNK